MEGPSPIKRTGVYVYGVSTPAFAGTLRAAAVLMCLLRRRGLGEDGKVGHILLIVTTLLSLAILLTTYGGDNSAVSAPTTRDAPTAIRTAPTPARLPPCRTGILANRPGNTSCPRNRHVATIVIGGVITTHPRHNLSGTSVLFRVGIRNNVAHFVPIFASCGAINRINPIHSNHSRFFHLVLP